MTWNKVSLNNVIMFEDGQETSSRYVFMKTRNLQEIRVTGKTYLTKTYSDFKVIIQPRLDKGANE
jgi:hypothetical protein